MIIIANGATGSAVAQESQLVEASFEEDISETGAGDIASFNLTLENTDKAYVQIGSEQVSFIEVIYIKAADPEEQVKVQINTRTLGTNTSVNNVYHAENAETLESSIHGGISSRPSFPLFERNGEKISYKDYVTDLLGPYRDEESTSSLYRPLQPTIYQIAVASNQDSNGLFNVSKGTANFVIASKELRLTPTRIGEITTYRAPSGEANSDTNPQTLLRKSLETDVIPNNKRAIIEIQATSIYGAMVAGPNGNGELNTDFSRLNEGMSTQVLQNLAQNVDSERIRFDISTISEEENNIPSAINLDAGDQHTFTLIDQKNDRFFIVIDTSSDEAYEDGGSPTSDTNFNVTLAYGDSNRDRDRYEFTKSMDPFESRSPFNSDLKGNHPYLVSGDEIIRSSRFTIEADPGVSSDSTTDESSGTVSRFQDSQEGESPLPGIIGMAIVIVLTGGVYLRFSESKSGLVKIKEQFSQTASSESTGATDGNQELNVQQTEYDNFDIGKILRSTKYVNVNRAVDPSEQVTVALYSTVSDKGNTIEESLFDEVNKGFGTWTNIDDHENILSVYANGNTPKPWAAVELANDSFDPADFIDEPIASKRELIVDLCDAVHEGHRYGLSHGSLDTATYIVDSREGSMIKIGDWGITEAAIDGDANQEADIEQVVEIAFELFTGETVSNADPESISYPDGFKSVFETIWENNSSYETVIHFRDAILEAT
jgi:hypothetical protein